MADVTVNITDITPFPDYMDRKEKISPPFVETDKVVVIRNGQTVWVGGDELRTVSVEEGSPLRIPKLDTDPIDAPGEGWAFLYVVEGSVPGTLTLKMMAETSTVPSEIIVDVGV